MPLLRPFFDPPFDTFGEVVAFCTQIFEVRSLTVTQFLTEALCREYNLCTNIMSPIGASPDGYSSYNLVSLFPRDCTYLNIMMDATGMYPDSFHPVKIKRSRDWKGKAKYHSRTLRPPKYYFIDFGLSQVYDPANGPALELPARGGDKTAPEHQAEHYDTPCDPFPTDIYYLGNLLREVFIQVRLSHLR